MPKQILVTDPAKEDIRNIIRWSRKEFGTLAAFRYGNLIEQGIRDLRDDPARPGSKERPELMVAGVRTYHLHFSRDHASGDRVKEPRHFLMYRVRRGGVIEVARVLHDSRDLMRHLPDAYKLNG